MLGVKVMVLPPLLKVVVPAAVAPFLFFTTSVEAGVRVNQSLYLDAFYDAGSIWRNARDFGPTRLFRGAGVGLATITPIGPLGIDLGYGFDRTKVNPNGGDPIPNPGWQIHFKLGQLF